MNRADRGGGAYGPSEWSLPLRAFFTLAIAFAFRSDQGIRFRAVGVLEARETSPGRGSLALEIDPDGLTWHVTREEHVERAWRGRPIVDRSLWWWPPPLTLPDEFVDPFEPQAY